MGRFVSRWILLAAVASFGGNGCAMSAPPPSSPRCTVIDGEKLPPGSGGAQALCAAIERAISERAPRTVVTVEVRVLPRSMLAAKLTVNGRELPEHKFASMDRELDQSSFARFAQSLVESLAQAQR